MNNLVREFRAGCPKFVDVHCLHRQGTSSKDLHGSDLAISVTKDAFRKIAFFQVKRIDKGHVELEHRQLLDAIQSGHPACAFFILAVDPDPSNCEIRIGEVEIELNAWPKRLTPRKNGAPGPQLSRSVPVAKWDDIATWTSKWLQCTVGRVTRQEFVAAEQAVIAGLTPSEQLVHARRHPRWLPSLLVKFALPEGYRDHDWS